MKLTDLNLILDQFYGVEYLAIEFECLSAGEENTNYHVTTLNKQFVLRIYNPEHSIRGERTNKSISTELNFMERVSEAGVSVPLVVPLKNGGKIGACSLDGIYQYFVLMTFINGVSPHDMSQKLVKDLAIVVNSLYEVGASLSSDKLPVEFDILSRLDRVFSQYRDDTTNRSNKHGVLTDMYSEILRSRKQIINGLNTGLVHGDIKLENILVNPGMPVVLLDFDDYRQSYLIEECVMTMMHNLHSQTRNLVRSGNSGIFIRNLKGDVLKSEVKQALVYFLRSRILYDLCKHEISGNYKLTEEILADQHIKDIILSNNRVILPHEN